MTRWTDEQARAILRRIFDAAVRSADPGAAVRRNLPDRPLQWRSDSATKDSGG